MSARRKDWEALSIQEGLFVEAYLACNCNGTEAARRAGYKGDKATLKVQAHRLLTRANVRDALDARRRQHAIDAYETLQRLTDHARASMEDFLTEGQIDLKKAEAEGNLALIKKLTERVITTEQGDIRTTTIELHDAQTALALFMKHHGLLETTLKKGDAAKDRAGVGRDARGPDPKDQGARERREASGRAPGNRGAAADEREGSLSS